MISIIISRYEDNIENLNNILIDKYNLDISSNTLEHIYIDMIDISFYRRLWSIEYKDIVDNFIFYNLHNNSYINQHIYKWLIEFCIKNEIEYYLI